jgi:rhodanese-related sulfurtransferase
MVAPSRRRKTLKKDAWQMVAEAKTSIDNLTPDQVAAEIAQGALLVDIREPHELAEMGRIPGALHAVRGLLEFYADPKSEHYYKPEFQPKRRVVLYCAAGGRSALAAVALQEMGYDAAHLEGGFAAWVEQAKPVEGRKRARRKS